VGGVGHLLNGPVESRFVGLRWFGEAAEFTDELQRRGADFFTRRRRLKVVQGLNISTHILLSLVGAGANCNTKSKPTIHRSGKLEKYDATGCFQV
jgi:hypothetical protein